MREREREGFYRESVPICFSLSSGRVWSCIESKEKMGWIWPFFMFIGFLKFKKLALPFKMNAFQIFAIYIGVIGQGIHISGKLIKVIINKFNIRLYILSLTKIFLTENKLWWPETNRRLTIISCIDKTTYLDNNTSLKWAQKYQHLGV